MNFTYITLNPPMSKLIHTGNVVMYAISELDSTPGWKVLFRHGGGGSDWVKIDIDSSDS